jgi:GNAT superfamily N-acetyltransferase
MTNLQAAFLYDQLQMVDRILQTKTLVRNRYRTLLPGLSVTNGLWMNVVRVPNGVYADIESKLRNNGIDTRPMFYPIGAHAHLSSIPATSTEIRRDELVMIPSSPSLTVYDQVYIASVLKSRTETLPTLHRIIAENRHLLDTFVSYDLPPTFRYFASRTVDGCLSSHTLTLVGTKDDRPVCYAHLEDRWIGICVLPEFQGSGYGSFLLRFLLDYAEVSGISPLRLTVDKSNDIAYRMYVKHGFSVQEVTETICRMIKNDSSSSVHR